MYADANVQREVVAHHILVAFVIAADHRDDRVGEVGPSPDFGTRDASGAGTRSALHSGAGSTLGARGSGSPRRGCGALSSGA